MESKPCQPCHTVYFRGFPEHITLEDLNEIFGEFGSIIKCFIHKSGTYGMVEFEDVSSCNTAIQALHSQPPLNLYVSMAKSQPSDRNSIKQKNHTSERAPQLTQFDETYVEEEFYIDENNSLVNYLKDPITNEIYIPIRYATNIRRIVKKVRVPVNQVLNNSYEVNANLSDEEASRSDLSITSVRKIKSKDHDYNITVEVDSDPPRGNRNQNHYQNGEQNNRRSFNNKTGGGSYSSNSEDENRRGKFQRGAPKNDFANKYPVSEKGDGYGSDQSGHNKFKPKSDQNRDNSRAQNNSPRSYQNNKFPKTSNDDRPWNSQSEQKSNSSPKNESTLSKKISSPQEKELPTIKEQKSEVTPNPSREVVAKMFNKKTTCKFVELPLNKFTEVKVEHAESESKAWVQICSKLEEFILFMEKILIYASTDSKPIKPEVGLICLANFEDTWFRAVILKSYPKIYVRFIDYGNECEVDGEILELPADMQSVPAYAVCIQLVNSGAGKLKNELTLKVKPVKLENDVYKVHLENEKSDQKEYINPLTSCQKNMMSKLKPSMDGLFQYTSKTSNTAGIAFFLPNSLDTDILELEKINDAVEELSSVKAQVGDLVVAKHEGWNRGIVLDTTDGFKVGFIDFGVIKTVKEVKPLPKEFHSIPQFTCQFTSKDINELVPEAEAMFEITKVEEKRVHCNISSESGTIQISFELWNPVREVSESVSTSAAPSEERCPPTLEIKNGDDCKIIETNPEFVYVKTRETAELMKGVDVGEYAANAPKLTEEPHIGQYVAAQFNGSWYRAIVTDISNNAAHVLFIDYGNKEIKPFFSLKQLGEFCVEIPQTIIKVKLRGFVNKKLAPKCLEYIQEFKTRVFKASFDGSPDNGVDFTMKDGTNLNDELIKLEMQGSATPPLKKEPHMNVKVPGKEDKRITAFDVEPISLGAIEVRFLGIIALKKYCIAICPNNPEILHKIHVDLLAQMTKYANSVAPKIPYIPELNETVLVCHSGKWYRGLTIGITEDDGFEVYLLDYGFDIEVTSHELRKMPAEFINKHKTLASFAVIKGMPEKPTKKLTDRIVDYFDKNEVYNVEVVSVQDYDSLTYEILFPCLMKRLKVENII